MSSWQQQYSNFLSDKPTDISIELETVTWMNPHEVEEALSKVMIRHEGNRFVATDITFAGEFDPSRRTFTITAEKGLLDPELEFKMMNRLLSMAYYTACELRDSRRPPAFLVHACGILRQRHVLLFTGPCEAGKTTIARLCGDKYGQVLNDEMVLVSRPRRDNEPLDTRGVPMIGGVAQRLNAAGPLSCVLLLKQSKRTAVHRLNRREAYLHFMRQIISPAYFGQSDSRALISLIAEFSDEVTTATPFCELEFTLDARSLWEAVEEVERSLG